MNPLPQRKSPLGAIAAGLSLAFVAGAQVPPAAQPTPRPAVTTPPVAPPRPPEPTLGNPAAAPFPLRAVGPGLFQIGDVTLDKERRSVSFPAVINMHQGPLEYLLVTSKGKVHESVLRTDARPDHLHVAMLLVDVKGTITATVPQPGRPPAAPANPANIEKPGAETLPGDKISMEVSWTTDGKDTVRQAEQLVHNAETKTAMAGGNWIYNGSEFVNGIFQAQVTGSLVSLITDRQALINNVGKGHENDDIWAVNTNGLPPVNTPVRITLRLAEGKTGK